MTENAIQKPPTRTSGLLRSLLLLLGFVLVLGAIGNILVTLGLIAAYSSDFSLISETVQQLVSDPKSLKNGWYSLMLLQGVGHLFTFLIPALFYWYLIEKQNVVSLGLADAPRPVQLVEALAFTIVAMPFISLVIELNQNMVFPEALKGVEEWMRSSEDKNAVLTRKYMDFTGLLPLSVAVLVVAVIAAVGEEVLFRGVLQTKVLQRTGNVHVAVWVSAAIFSAIHFQFYGFFPRMLLGALFGYIFAYTGNLWIAIFSHFVNNGLMVIMLYLYRQQRISINPESNENVPLWLAVFSLMGALLMFNHLRRRGTSHTA